jgi:hypothetical protein
MFYVSLIFSGLIVAALLIIPGYVARETTKSLHRIYIRKDKSRYAFDINKLIILSLSVIHILIFGLLYLFTTASNHDSMLIFLLSFWVYPLFVLLPYYISVPLHYYFSVKMNKKITDPVELESIKKEYKELSRFLTCTIFSIFAYNIALNAIMNLKQFTDAID